MKRKTPFVLIASWLAACGCIWCLAVLAGQPVADRPIGDDSGSAVPISISGRVVLRAAECETDDCVFVAGRGRIRWNGEWLDGGRGLWFDSAYVNTADGPRRHAELVEEALDLGGSVYVQHGMTIVVGPTPEGWVVP